eukprot:2366069-Rhodomonas_salina.1
MSGLKLVDTWKNDADHRCWHRTKSVLDLDLRPPLTAVPCAAQHAVRHAQPLQDVALQVQAQRPELGSVACAHTIATCTDTQRFASASGGRTAVFLIASYGRTQIKP